MATHSAPVMNPEAKKSSRIKIVLEMIKFEHSVFALPFALVGALLGARATHGGWPTWRQLAWVIVAMVSARSAAMTVNRIVDLRYDRENPRTKQRALATGAAFGFVCVDIHDDRRGGFLCRGVAIKFAGAETGAAGAGDFVFLFVHQAIHDVVASFFGFALGISPAAAWIAVTGSFDLRMLILCAAVTLWVGGFDVLYACQDLEYDRGAGLFSIPQRYGVAKALAIARVMHIAVVILLGVLAASFSLPWPAWAGIAVVAGLLAYEHSLVKADDLSKLDAAFFAMNGYISMSFLLFWGAAVALWRV